MQNNLPSKCHPSGSVVNINQILPPQQILYTQTFQCHCLQLFKTIDEYHLHITIDHHDNYLTSHPIDQSKNLIDGNLPIQEVKQTNMNQNVVINNVSQNEQKSRPIENQFNIQISGWQKNQNQGFANFLAHNDPLHLEKNLNQQLQHPSQSNLVKTHFASQQQQKEIDFRYVKAYYQHKMVPFYRQFDIQPIHNQQSHQQKYSQSQKLKKLYRQSPIDPQDSLGSLRQNSLKDQKKIHLEFDARILPIQNAFITFIQNFIEQNSKLIAQITPEKREAIPKTFFSRITKLQQMMIGIRLKEMSQMSQRNREEDFMQNDLFMSLSSFIQFVTQKLRFYEIWIVQTMAVIIFDTIIEYYIQNYEEMYENLKVSDFSYLYSTILMNTQYQRQDLSFQISYSTMAQFVLYFNQWCSVFQYINNNKRVDYIQPLMNQINQINEVYSDNVLKYRKITKSRRATYMKRMKRKMIEKRRNEVVKREKEQKNDLLEDYLKAKIVPNIRRRSEGGGYELIPNKISKFTDSSNYLPFSNFKYQKSVNQIPESHQFEDFKGTVDIVQDQRRQFEKRLGRAMVNEQKICGIEQRKEQRLNDQLIDQEFQAESSCQYVPKQSEYVNYFSQEKEDQRQKCERDWNSSLKMFKQIMIDSQKIKPIIKHKVRQQLQQVYSLCSTIKFDSPFYYHLRKQMKHILLRYSNEPVQKLQDNLPRTELITKKIEVFNGEVSPFKKDPFLVIKDYRYKNSVERKQAEKGLSLSGQKGNNSSMEIRSNYFIAQNNPQFQQVQQINHDDPFAALL